MSNKILFTSNCYGEDRSAALIAAELKKIFKQNKSDLRIFGASLISGGDDYKKKGIDVLFSSKVPPSGGFPTRSISGFFFDIFSGSIGNVFRFIGKIKKTEGIDLCIVVGDVPLLILTKLGLKKDTPVLFLAPAKSDYIEPHYKIEEWYIRKTAEYIFTHDQFTAGNLAAKGLKAVFRGNPMMDDLEPDPVIIKNIKALLGPGKPVIGLLPGSRDEAYDNLVMILNAAEKISYERKAEFISAIPGTLNNEIISKKAAAAGWAFSETRDFSFLRKNEIRVLLVRKSFPAVIEISDVIIGLAGTANEQAVGKGKPVVSFTGSGPQTTRRRIEEQERLLGGAMKYVTDYPHGVVKEVCRLIDDGSERERMGRAGRERMGPAGGALNIAEFIVKYYI